MLHPPKNRLPSPVTAISWLQAGRRTKLSRARATATESQGSDGNSVHREDAETRSYMHDRKSGGFAMKRSAAGWQLHALARGSSRCTNTL